MARPLPGSLPKSRWNRRIYKRLCVCVCIQKLVATALFCHSVIPEAIIIKHPLGKREARHTLLNSPSMMCVHPLSLQQQKKALKENKGRTEVE